MTPALDGIRVLLLDIEGTTTPMAFVQTRLFTYAREHLDEYLLTHVVDGVIPEFAARLKAEYLSERGVRLGSDLWGATSDRNLTPRSWHDATPEELRASVATYARWLMDRDRKSPGLKLLQGLIWEEGYQAGDLHGEIFDDVPRAFERWRHEGRFVAIYSSGSELAQRRLFASTPAGDLTLQIAAFFDTAVGAKVEADSYRRIARALNCKPAEILFVSDVTAELQAARDAGCATRLCVRPGNAPQSDADQFEQIGNLDELA